MINVNDAGVFFICDAENVETIKRELRELERRCRMRPHCAKLSIVGAGMRGTPGVMYRVVRAVAEADVEIIHSTDSNITISILVPEDDAARAEQALHDFFKLGNSDRQRRLWHERSRPHVDRDDHAVRRTRRGRHRARSARVANLARRARERRRRRQRDDRRIAGARDDEKLALFAAIKDAVGSRASIVAGTGGNNTHHSVELTIASRRARRRRDPRGRSVLQQADAGRHAAALRRDRRSDRSAGHGLQHPRPHRRKHAAGDAARTRDALSEHRRRQRVERRLRAVFGDLARTRRRASSSGRATTACSYRRSRSAATA